MKTIDTEELKQLQFRILCLFDEYCTKHGLRYYLYAGTLLGALRHKGFIPWDDDIDVNMPRPDYNRFCELVKSEPVSPELTLLTTEIDEQYICPFGKLVDTRTDGHENHMHESIHNGAWIDVFPIDGLPDDEQERVKHLSRLQRDIKRLQLSIRPLLFCANPLRYAKRLAIYLRYHHIDSHKLAVSLEQLGQKYAYETSRYIGVTVFGNGFHNVIKKEGFEDVDRLTFEGRMFNVPGSYKEYLSHIFGPDYMTPPPEKNRVNAHGYTCWWKTGFEPEEDQTT